MVAHQEVPKPRTLKAEEEAEARKRAFFNESIKIVLSEPRCAWTVARFRLTPEFVQQLIDRSILAIGVTPAYLKCNTGIIMPHDMQRLCIKHETYELVVAQPNRTNDSKSNHGYKGEREFTIRNVPSHSQNNLYTVSEKHLMEWVRQSLLREDPDIVNLDKQITACKKSLDSIALLMQKAAENPIVNDRGIIITGKHADQKRQERYDIILKNKYDTRAELEDAEANRSELHHTKRNQIQLSVFFLKANEWKIELHGERKDYYDALLLNKRDWNTSFLYAYPNDLDPQQRSEDSEYLVDIGCIAVDRVENGFGCYHRPSYSNVAQCEDESIHESQVISYHGTYEHGLYQGCGFLFSRSHFYGGGFDRNLPQGQGTIIHKDGDVIQGEFGLSNSKVHENRYARGLPNGNNSITFADGAFYEGELRNGIITGKGTYISANGDRLEGEFVKGNLIRGTKEVKLSGETCCGTFSDGLLDGLGHYKSATKRSTYQGNFVDGKTHGVGEQSFYKKNFKDKLAQYTGYFCNNDRSGIGSLEIQDSGFGFQDVGKECLRIDSTFLAGEPKSGGMITNLEFHTSIPTTNRPSSKYRLLNRFKRVEEQKDLAIMRASLESEKNDFHLRSTIELKKKEIYNHYHGRITESLAGNDDLPRMLSEREMRLPSQSSSSKVRSPRYFKEDKDSSALNTATLGNHELADGSVHNIINALEKEWMDMGSNFQVLKMEMQVIYDGINLMQEELNLINLTDWHKSAKATGNPL